MGSNKEISNMALFLFKRVTTIISYFDGSNNIFLILITNYFPLTFTEKYRFKILIIYSYIDN